uniref:Zinc finger, NFX1-type containing 1 n=1 Tax=Scophthalmus maximus TaxID=52904 RepID=A0A8D3C3X8_SCOMX
MHGARGRGQRRAQGYRAGEQEEMDVRRRGQSLDARGGRRGERGGGLRDRQERKGGRSNSTERARAPQGRHLDYKTLEILSEKDPSLVAIALSSNPALPDTLRETTMRQDLVELLCLVLSKAFKSQTDRGSLQRLAGIIKDSGFFRTVLPHYVASMRSEVNSLRRAQCPQHLENILVLKIFPAGSVEAVSLLLTLLEHSMKSLSALGADIQPQMEETVEGLQAQVRHLQRGSREGALTTGEGEQEDFWNKPIYPTHEELQLDHRPFLRPNLTSERYKDTHHYLDTQFRLLREDFVKPLRDGIQEFLWNHIEPGKGNKRLKAKHFDNFYVYFDTRLVVLNCTNTGLAYTVQFDIKPLKSVPWQNSKRLLNGSLVCLSCDHFESFLFATVSDRDLKDLTKGQVQIMFTEESRLKLADIQKDQVFLMIESTAFFEAYRYVLEGLQEQAVNSLPFQRYIVECSTNVQPPAYLRRQDKYDLSSIAEPKYQKSTVPFRCLEAGAWPKMEVLGLDESQMKALRLALTKELAIIQGPPGTGKTHVGLKIARALLNNGALWGNKFGTGTMLIVCYTNHALDQFLEGKQRCQYISDIFHIRPLSFFRFKRCAVHLFSAPAEEAMELEEEGLIEIAEEADLIQAERIIEDNIGPRRGRDDRMKEAMKSAVREVEELMLALNLDADEIQAEQSEGEWEMQRDPKMKLKNEIRKELRKSSDMTEEEENLVLNVWVLSLPDRWRLYRLWVARFRSELRTSALKSEEAYQNAVERLADVRRHESLCILRKAKVIGMTTTGAAKYRRVLQEVGPRLVIVEEAAQVLEAHTITTLSEACQHLILIGDHQQLQPSTTVYELGKRYNMKISMFERLVKMGLPFVRLNYQHRMRPEIARLLTPHIYPELENHPSVLDFEKIKVCIAFLCNIYKVKKFKCNLPPTSKLHSTHILKYANRCRSVSGNHSIGDVLRSFKM